MEAAARAIFRTYNYHEIRTPIFEETQLFARGVGEETDIVTKEMYTFIDRDDSSLTLRPENTASVIRAYIEHRLDQRPGVQKLYYMGPMFRRERPQKGRYRQFFQIGAEAIGSESPMVDAEVIEMVVEILRSVGLSGYQLLINSVGDGNCRPQAGVDQVFHTVEPLCFMAVAAAYGGSEAVRETIGALRISGIARAAELAGVCRQHRHVIRRSAAARGENVDDRSRRQESRSFAKAIKAKSIGQPPGHAG